MHHAVAAQATGSGPAVPARVLIRGQCRRVQSGNAAFGPRCRSAQKIALDGIDIDERLVAGTGFGYSPGAANG